MESAATIFNGSVNLLTVLVSIASAVVISIISSAFNWFLWKNQFSKEQKSEYQKLYHARKLEIYEECARISTEYHDKLCKILTPISQEIKKDQTEYESQRRNISAGLRDFAVELNKFSLKHVFYISKKVWNALGGFASFIHYLSSSIRSGKKIEENVGWESSVKLADILTAISDELGVEKVLNDSDMKRIFYYKNEQVNLDKGEIEK